MPEETKSMRIFREAEETEQKVVVKAIDVIRQKQRDPGLNIQTELTRAIKEIIGWFSST